MDRYVRRRIGLVAISIMLAGIAAAQAAPADPLGGTGGDPLSGTLSVRVVAAGSTDPIVGAFVMVGPSEGNPFAGNVEFTDGTGEVVFNDPSLTGSITVTAGAAGMGYHTVFDLGVDEVVLPLAPVAPAATARIGDDFAGIEVNNGIACIGDGNFDVGFILPALSVEEALSPGGVLDLFLSSSEEPMSTPLGEVPVPSNIYAPQQCELFGTYTKQFYHLRTPLGQRTIFGLSARGPRQTFLDLLSLPELDIEAILLLLPDLTFREMDVLRDLQITGNTPNADLVANLPLTTNLTLQVSNAQLGTTVLGVGFGRLTTPQSTEELIVTGVSGYDPDDAGQTSANLAVSTRAAIGELSDMIQGALVLQLRDGEIPDDGATMALVRSGVTPPASLPFGSYFDIVEILSQDEEVYAWSDVVSATSPATRHVNRSRIILETPVPNPDAPGELTTEKRVYWTLYTPGSALGLTRPSLPASAPTPLPDTGATPDPDIVKLQHEVLFLGDDPDGFDYGAFAFSDPGNFGTHSSSQEQILPCDTGAEIGGLRVGKGIDPQEITLIWTPSTDICHDAGVRGYEVYGGDDPTPASAPGDWPSDPGFVAITDDDLDGSFANPTFRHVAPDGLVLYVVVDRGTSGNEGPSGHY
jgi:hypothetical protein